MQPTQYQDSGLAVSRQLSPHLWANCNLEEYRNGYGPKRAAVWFDDFHRVPSDAVGYNVDTSDDNADLSILTDEQVGVAQMQVDSDDNEEGWFQGVSPLARFEKNSGKKLWYECRFKATSVATDRMIALGLAELLSAGDNAFQVDDTGAIADINFVGVRTLNDDGDGLDVVYTESGDTGDTVQANEAKVLTADTYVKFGIYFNGITTIKFYIDGIDIEKDIEITVADFPNESADLMAPVFGAKVGAAVAQNLEIDWVGMVQEIG